MLRLIVRDFYYNEKQYNSAQELKKTIKAA